jgi:2-phospho-L-lactate guanylyltransferase
MIGWTAVVPLKMGPNSKSRLGSLLSPEHRRHLVGRMADHVVNALDAVGAIDETVVIGTSSKPDWPVRLVPDLGRGLNGELDAAALTIINRLIVIHGDLPCVEPRDISDLLTAAEESGFAIAADRHGQGTNALALTHLPAGFAFAFGEGSFAAHHALLGDKLAIIDRPGLACDIDTPEDFQYAVSRCYLSFPETVL